MVADFGYQNEQSFLVVDGPREYLVDDDLDFVLVGSSVNIVDKSTGDVVFWSHVDHAEEIMAMTPVPGHEPLTIRTPTPDTCAAERFSPAATNASTPAGSVKKTWRGLL